MATIMPIRGIRYSPKKIGDMAEVLTPPYDIIDAVAQARYYARQPFNIIRLELGQIFNNDDERNNRYTRAADYYRRWLEEGILEQESQPAFYLYEQEFSLRGQPMVRSGFFCGVKLEPYSQGNILPHEETLSKPKADRLQLMRACKANFSPVFGLYEDPGQEVNQAFRAARGNRTPDIELTDESGEKHRLWVITDPAVQEQIIGFLATRPIFIADGHHRYETALTYYEEMTNQSIPVAPTVLMVLVTLNDPGLVILPTHRLIKNLNGFDLDRFLEQLSRYFTIEGFPLPALKSEQKAARGQFFRDLRERGSSRHVFGFYAPNKTFYLLTLKKEVDLKQLFTDTVEAWSDIGVAILDHLILDRLLEISSEQRRSQEKLTYTHDEMEAVEAVDSGEAVLAFFPYPPKVEQVTAVARSGEKMPQKSTYFYPKLITGLVINPLSSV